MSEITPLRGRRVKAVRCHVQGHESCDISTCGAPPSRTTEEQEALRYESAAETPLEKRRSDARGAG